MATQPGLQPVGIHVHLGSQIISTEPLQRGASAVVRLARELRDGGIQLDHIDIGGGLGISYDGSRAPTAAEYAAAVLPIVAPSGLSIALEPGRYIVGRGRCAARARGRPEGCRRRTSFRRARRRHDRADAAHALWRLPPHRRRHAARGPRRVLRHRRTGVREHRRLRRATGASTSSKSAICSRFSTPARTDRRCRRTTTGARCRRK